MTEVEEIISYQPVTGLINDIVIYIMTFLNDGPKRRFLSSSKDLHKLKDKIYYDCMMKIEKIHTLWYFDMFTYVEINNLEYKLPNSITKLCINFDKAFDQN